MTSRASRRLLLVLAVSAALGLALAARGGDFTFGPRIALVPLSGEIKESDAFVERLETLARDDRIKAVVLRIDSPGGAVGPSQEMYTAVRALSQSKPVIASLGSVAASGGYYVACAADIVVANPGTLTGSVGVIIPVIDVAGLLDKLGVKAEMLTAGKRKAMGSSFRALSAEERTIFQSMLDDIQEQFLDAVTETRKLTPAQLSDVRTARIYTGEQARKVGLVDEMGGLEDAVRIAAERAGIEGEPSVQRIEVDDRPWWWALVAESRVASGNLLGGIASLLGSSREPQLRLPLALDGARAELP